MVDVLTFVGFWIIVMVLGAAALGKWLKRQRLKYGGSQEWDVEWTD